MRKTGAGFPAGSFLPFHAGDKESPAALLDNPDRRRHREDNKSGTAPLPALQRQDKVHGAALLPFYRGQSSEVPSPRSPPPLPGAGRLQYRRILRERPVHQPPR